MKNSVIVHYLGQTARILASRLRWKAKLDDVFSYTLLTFHYVWNTKLVPSDRKRTRVSGMDMEFLDWGAFRHLFEELFIGRIYDIRLSNPSPMIVDCGSNIGMSIAFFKKVYPHAQVLGFEPDPANFSCLHKNVETNFDDTVVHNKALSDREGPRTLFARREGNNSTTKTLFKDLLGEAKLTSVVIPAVRLSDYILKPVDLLKLDVEGAETLVLRDLINTGKLGLVQKMIIEFHSFQDDAEHNLHSFLKLLDGQGFACVLSAEPPYADGKIDSATIQHVLIYAARKESMRILSPA